MKLEYPLWIAVFWIVSVAAVTIHNYTGLKAVAWNGAIIFLGLVTAFSGGYEYSRDNTNKDSTEENKR